MNQFKHLRMSGLELMNNVKKKESINSLLLIIFLFIPTLTIPLKVYMNSGISVWILTLIIIIVSLSINKFKIKANVFGLIYIIILLITINIIVVDYKNIVINNLIELLKFGVISLYLASQVTNFNLLLKYWYLLGVINLFISIIFIELVLDEKISYMSFGTYLVYSFIIFLVYFYQRKKFRIINLILIISTFILIFLFGNRSSILACIILILYFEIRNIKKQKIYYSIFKIIILLTPIVYILNNLYNLLGLVRKYLNNYGYNSYTLDKFIQTFETNIIETSSGREILYERALKMIKDSYLIPRGLGYYEFVTGYNYPHNIILDMFIILGFFAIPITIYFFVIFIKTYFYSNNESMKLILMTLLIFILCRLFFSGTFINEPAIWTILGILIAKINYKLKYNLTISYQHQNNIL